MGCKPTTNNETKDANNSGLKCALQALRPLVPIILSLFSYKNKAAFVKEPPCCVLKRIDWSWCSK
jgi:hypothetical protein